MRPPISKAIDPARTGMSKSVIVATSLCARKGWYSEAIRDDQGRRVSVPMPERVLFGTALDEAVQVLNFNVREGVPVTPELLEEAIQEGLGAMASRPGAEDLDPVLIEGELEAALAGYVEDVLPVLRERYGDGLKGLRLQGNDGESLRSGDFIGTPDMLFVGDNPAVWDVKSSPRSKSNRDLYSAEMAHYAALYLDVFGALPTVGYLTWVRTTRSVPKWQVLGTNATPLHLALATAYRTATKVALDSPVVDSLPFNTAMCGTCEWKVNRPEINFGGCLIGQAVEELEAVGKEGLEHGI